MSSTSTDRVTCTIDAGIADLRLNRADKHDGSAAELEWRRCKLASCTAPRSSKSRPDQPCSASVSTEKVAPCGSLTTAKRPTGMVVGGTQTLPPSSSIFLQIASVSATAK